MPGGRAGTGRGGDQGGSRWGNLAGKGGGGGGRPPGGLVDPVPLEPEEEALSRGCSHPPTTRSCLS